jgi:WD40 repeat protein
VNTLVFSPSGQRLVTGSADLNVWIWKLDTEEELLSLPCRVKGPINLIRFSPDGRRIVAIKQVAAPSFFESFLPSEKVRTMRRLVDLASRKISQLTWQTQSPEQVLQALRRDPQLDPDVKKIALDIARRQAGIGLQQLEP